MKILFVSRGDACRSVMAKALAESSFGKQVTIETAGINPRKIDPLTVAIMREVTLDVSLHTPKELDLMAIDSYDMIVVVEPRNPFDGQKLKAQFLHWPLPDPHDPPAKEEEILTRLKDTRVAISKYIKMLTGQVESRKK